MNFLSLEYYVIVAKERNFTRAAEKLHVTQQTLSASISGLEKELGTQLLIRHVPLEMTFAGERFLEYAENALISQHNILQQMQDITGNGRGTLKVGIGSTRNRAIMPAIISRFQEQYPHYSVEIAEGSNQALQKMLQNGELDVAIAAFGEQMPGIKTYPFYRENIILLMAKDLFDRHFPGEYETIRQSLMEGDFRRFRDCPFVLCRPEDYAGKVARYYFRTAGIRPEIKVLSDTVETLISLCCRSVGACFCPDTLLNTVLHGEMQDKVLRFSLTEGASYDVSFGVPKDKDFRVVQGFIRAAKETAAETAAAK